MLRRSTVIYLVIALTLASGVWIVTQRQHLRQEEASTAAIAAPLFPFAATEIQAITLNVNGETLIFEQRSAPIAQWWLVEPVEVVANRGAIAFLLNLLTEPQPYEAFLSEATTLGDYGLAPPYATITAQTQGGQQTQLTLGTENFDRTKIYGRLDAQETVLVLPLDFRNGVMRPLSEWRLEAPEN
ncbi:DUF4340 domain-containing protein [Picosynechococcus sp. NKBG15041c]|uniref:DUF4340 domain-containing protein n=1 Tax=Picosynechococcus sp. NKBG15041c TaxID=1407650 RepID=UPI000688006F|nr:DUF4340 domain-containing protein [Picosynechococcus sp. NKBG15041c]